MPNTIVTVPCMIKGDLLGPIMVEGCHNGQVVVPDTMVSSKP